MCMSAMPASLAPVLRRGERAAVAKANNLGKPNRVGWRSLCKQSPANDGSIKGKRVKRVGKVLIAAAAGCAMNMAATAWAADAIAPPVTLPDGSKTQEGAVDKDGKWTLPDGTPTYPITTKDGKIDKLD